MTGQMGILCIKAPVVADEPVKPLRSIDLAACLGGGPARSVWKTTIAVGLLDSG